VYNNAGNAPGTEDYVRNQEEHHRGRTFQDEYRVMLTQYGIDFDEQYVWDWLRALGREYGLRPKGAWCLKF
jgi:hypothetical protein